VARVAPFWGEIWEAGPAWFVQAGQYTLTPDGRPLLGQTAIEGLFVNAGCEGRGVMRSVATARIVVDLVTGGLASRQNPYRLDREFVERPHLDAL
jgi:glycine/D-amino acid oxidase-like deaminating enzyme